MSELDLIVDREIRKAAACCSGVATLTVIEVAERLAVEDFVAALLAEDAAKNSSDLPITPL